MTGEPLDERVIMVRCSRCEDLPNPDPVSTRRTCSKCGRAVWFAQSTQEAIDKRFPGRTVALVCLRCRVEDEGPIMNLPEQVDALRALGDSDEVIAYKLALADVSGGVLPLEEAEREILALPESERARAFPDALRRARMLVRATHWPRN